MAGPINFASALDVIIYLRRMDNLIEYIPHLFCVSGKHLLRIGERFVPTYGACRNGDGGYTVVLTRHPNDGSESRIIVSSKELLQWRRDGRVSHAEIVRGY